MKVLHGTWIPNQTNEFIESGSFYLWVETSVIKERYTHQRVHPGHLSEDELINFLVQTLGIKEPVSQLKESISTKYFALPTANNQPLPSPELIKYLEWEFLGDYEEFQYWNVACCETTVSGKVGKSINIIKLLKDIHFLALYNPNEFQLGSDILFWYHYTQAFKEIILKDQYIPALKYRPIATATNKKKNKQQRQQEFEIYATWEIISEQYEANIQKYVDYMPLICTAGSNTEEKQIEFYDQETLLRHFSEFLLHNLVTNTPSTVTFDKQISDSLIYYCLYPQKCNPLKTDAAFQEYRQWLTWKNRINGT
ncbi:MAG: hypothetical protein AB3A66_10605 [Nodularia sp. CChRGM 3473]